MDLANYAIMTVIMAAVGTEGVTGATIANVATAPVYGFADALPVCLFVLILGGFLGRFLSGLFTELVGWRFFFFLRLV